MRKNTFRLQCRLLVAIVTLSLLASIPNALAQVVGPTDPPVLGKTYGDWAAAWWQWVYSIPVEENPLLDNTGENCGVGQSSSPVFYFVGAFSDEVPDTPLVFDVERNSCTVPAGRYIFFPVLNVTADTTKVKGDAPDEFPRSFGTPIGAQRDEAARFANIIDVGSLEVLVDGMPVSDLGNFRAQSPTFPYSLPRRNIQGVPSGDHFSTTDGYWVMLEPLSEGPHTVQFRGNFISDGKDPFPPPAEGGIVFGLNVTYNFVVE